MYRIPKDVYTDDKFAVPCDFSLDIFDALIHGVVLIGQHNADKKTIRYGLNLSMLDLPPDAP
ncbi:hypothetical protein D7X30_10445 [Corallococcus sp. AB011P]|nr:hypothetical protein D7X30_10445 [Corallococcus sp. AB011P]